MKLKSVDLTDKEMGREIERFLDFIGYSHWKKLIEQTDKTEDGFYKELYLLKRNPFIRPLKQFIQLKEKGKCIWKHTTEELIALARHAFIINRVAHDLNDNGKNYIKGKLRDEGGIRSFLFELQIATHFLRRGLNVEFLEYLSIDTSGKTYEFLVSGDGIEREVECKWKSVDAGRKITRPGFYLLCDEIRKRVVLGIKGKKCLVELICNKNLGKNRNIFIEITKSILEGISSRVEFISDNNFQIRLYHLPDNVLITSDEQAASVIAPYYSEKSHFMGMSNSDSTLIIKAESEERDRVLDSIYEELKGATEKFTGTRPALIACYIEGISTSEWEELIGINGLSAMTSHLLSKASSKHTHTIAYNSEPEPNIIGHIKDYKSGTLYFPNSNCLYHKNEDIFFLKNKKDM